MSGNKSTLNESLGGTSSNIVTSNIQLIAGLIVDTSSNMTIDGTKTFVGSVIVPTVADADNSTSVATTAFVKNQSYLTTLGASGLYALANQPTITGLATMSTISATAYIDTFNTVSWGTLTFDFGTGSNWWFNTGTPASVTGALTFNGLPTVSGKSYTFAFLLPTTVATNYYAPTSVTITGSGTATFKSSISALSTPSHFIIQTFTCLYLNTTWYVLSSASSF